MFKLHFAETQGRDKKRYIQELMLFMKKVAVSRN